MAFVSEKGGKRGPFLVTSPSHIQSEEPFDWPAEAALPLHAVILQ